MNENIEHRFWEIEKRLDAIEVRNARVENEKAWETSLCRKLSILVLTYAVMCLVFWSLVSTPVCYNALVPTFGCFFSKRSCPV